MHLLQHPSCKYRSIGLVFFKRCFHGGTTCASVSHWVRSKIIHGMRLRRHHLGKCQFIGYGLQSSMGCVYVSTACASTGLLGTVFNHPWDASTAAPLEHLSVYWVWSTIIHGVKFTAAQLVHVLVYWVRSIIIHGMRYYGITYAYGWCEIIHGIRFQ